MINNLDVRVGNLFRANGLDTALRLHEFDRVNTFLFDTIERKFGRPLTAPDISHVIVVYEFEDRIDLYWNTQWMSEMLYNPPIQFDEKYSISFYWNPKFEIPAS